MVVCWHISFIFFCTMQVRLPSMDGQVALVPWADMLNHSCEVCCFSKTYIDSSNFFPRMFNDDLFLTDPGGDIFGL